MLLLLIMPCRHAVEAIDAHTTEGWKQLQRGIEMAKCMQQAIIQ